MQEQVIKKLPYTLEDFDYTLPKDMIAQRPLPKRDMSRLLVVNRRTGQWEDKTFESIIDYFQAGEVVVLNDTKVFPARLEGRKSTGGRVEILLVGPSDDSKKVWRVLVQPKLREKQKVIFHEAKSQAVYIGRDRDGTALMKFDVPDVKFFAARFGQMPLPPYVRRSPDEKDRVTYQTVYGCHERALASPTAGLHFTESILQRIMHKGVRVVNLTLHVGYGTFRPVQSIENHRMHPEHFDLPATTAKEVNQALQDGRRIWAVGTTSVRVLETCVMAGRLIPGGGQTDLFLFPPAEFEIVQGLLTNFHLPRSTLLMLVSAFMGHQTMKKAYHHAIETHYRFYSYGDAMLIV